MNKTNLEICNCCESDSKHTKLLEYGENTFWVMFSKNIIPAAMSPHKGIKYDWFHCTVMRYSINYIYPNILTTQMF